jgi:hypothetical protein
MVEQLGGRRFERSDTAGLMLEKQSVLSFRLPDPSGAKAYQMASLLAETRVNKFQLKPLPPQTFTPPRSSSKLANPPAPSNSPEGSGETLDVVAPNSPRFVTTSRAHTFFLDPRGSEPSGRYRA